MSACLICNIDTKREHIIIFNCGDVFHISCLPYLMRKQSLDDCECLYCHQGEVRALYQLLSGILSPQHVPLDLGDGNSPCVVISRYMDKNPSIHEAKVSNDSMYANNDPRQTDKPRGFSLNPLQWLWRKEEKASLQMSPSQIVAWVLSNKQSLEELQKHNISAWDLICGGLTIDLWLQANYRLSDLAELGMANDWWLLAGLEMRHLDQLYKLLAGDNVVNAMPQLSQSLSGMTKASHSLYSYETPSAPLMQTPSTPPSIARPAPLLSPSLAQQSQQQQVSKPKPKIRL
jgi:hypothetical protein